MTLLYNFQKSVVARTIGGRGGLSSPDAFEWVSICDKRLFFKTYRHDDVFGLLEIEVFRSWMNKRNRVRFTLYNESYENSINLDRSTFYIRTKQPVNPKRTCSEHISSPVQM